MAILIAQIILLLALLYLVVGALFTPFFIAHGLHKIDEGTQGASLGFKIIIIPGCIMLWPVLLVKWRKKVRL